MNGEAAHQRIAAVARDGYGRLVAVLCRRTGDPDAAADAVGAAFLSALEAWPQQGVPASPEAWLLTAARNHAVEQWRRARRAGEREPALVVEIEALLQAASATPAAIPDERLRLLFACAHPAIDPAVRAALMLQLAIGVEVPRMAAAFLLSPATLAQRLVRAKARIRLAGIPFDEPEPAEWPARLHDVLEAVYGAYTSSLTDAASHLDEAGELREEALFLSALLTRLLPDDAEVLGLRALLLYAESRRDSRHAADGRFVPLAEQDPAAWDAACLDEAEALLRRCAALGRPGALQTEAAIHSLHAARRLGGPTPWTRIALLYRVLLTHWPSQGARVGAAVAFTECAQFDAAEQALAAVPPALAERYAAWWAARAHLDLARGQRAAAVAALQRAAGLSTPGAQRNYLLGRAAALQAE